MKKIILTIILGLSFNNVINASDIDADNSATANEEKEMDEIAQALRLYFEEIGSFDKKGDYVITDWAKLRAQINSGDKTAQIVYQLYLKTNKGISISTPKDFAVCVVGKFSNSYGKIARAFLTGAIYTYISQKQYDLAARLMFGTLKAAGFKVNAAGIAVEAGLYGWQCRSKW